MNVLGLIGSVDEIVRLLIRVLPQIRELVSNYGGFIILGISFLIFLSAVSDFLEGWGESNEVSEKKSSGPKNTGQCSVCQGNFSKEQLRVVNLNNGYQAVCCLNCIAQSQ
ncbi:MULTISPECIES: hypothetical protein [Halorussus]|uniref:hypothetical protein n=1 Tax=Halorussus TaxID=1070314 RepID=UPI0013B36C72|nr:MULTISPECIES: hypothetical protein [Halorussus]NHN58315.1 hypothetical protein [Halorussus sp. JP-T4]